MSRLSAAHTCPELVKHLAAVAVAAALTPAPGRTDGLALAAQFERDVFHGPRRDGTDPPADRGGAGERDAVHVRVGHQHLTDTVPGAGDHAEAPAGSPAPARASARA